MINKLKYKFVLINMILISIVLVIIFISVYESTQQRLVGDSMITLQNAIMQDRGGGDDHKPIFGAKDAPDFMHIPTFVVSLDENNNIIDARGALYDLTDQEAINTIVQECLTSEKDSGIIADADLRYLRQSSETGTIIAFADRKMEVRTLSSLILTSVLVGASSLIVFFIISLYLGKWALRPVAKAWEQQQQFVADASHELRTPLTVILANAGIVLSHRNSTVQDQSKWIEYIQTEATRMNTLVDNLLFLARTDDAKNKIIPMRINLSDTVYGELLPFESVIYEQEKEMETQIDPDLCVNGDENKVKQLVAILLDNAIKYSDERGKISVSLKESPERKVILSVANTGTPIPADQIDSIFDRFYRADESRSREQGGYGLGLAIAQSIALMHNAKITVQSSEGLGTTFSVIFSGATPV
ncbi:MAG: dltS [Firmicutes bacterium]|nr:dltS [Bacillota bacterium]